MIERYWEIIKIRKMREGMNSVARSKTKKNEKKNEQTEEKLLPIY